MCIDRYIYIIIYIFVQFCWATIGPEIFNDLINESMAISKHGHFGGERPEPCDGNLIRYIQPNMLCVFLKMKDLWNL